MARRPRPRPALDDAGAIAAALRAVQVPCTGANANPNAVVSVTQDSRYDARFLNQRCLLIDKTFYVAFLAVYCYDNNQDELEPSGA